MQVQVFGVAAPQRWRLGRQRVATIRAEATIAARLVVAHQAHSAVVARNQNFDGHPVARLDTPAFGGPFADFFDDAQWFVARNRRVVAAHLPAVVLNITAANSTALDFEQPIVRPNDGSWKFLNLDRSRSNLDGCANHLHERSLS